jgi:hypothetical protein
MAYLSPIMAAMRPSTPGASGSECFSDGLDWDAFAGAAVVLLRRIPQMTGSVASAGSLKSLGEGDQVRQVGAL